MPGDLNIRCVCGTVCGTARGIAAKRGNRLICYCDDCQSFAHFLGRAHTILDVHGGTDIFQMSPAQVEFTAGAEQLACMRLRPKGLLRWYADCCKTPIGNTLATRQIPFVGLIHACLEKANDPERLESTLGPVRARVHCRFATGERSALFGYDRAPLSLMARVAGMILIARLRGDQRRSPFFDARSGQPSAEPKILSEQELRAVERARDRR